MSVSTQLELHILSCSGVFGIVYESIQNTSSHHYKALVTSMNQYKTLVASMH